MKNETKNLMQEKIVMTNAQMNHVVQLIEFYFGQQNIASYFRTEDAMYLTWLDTFDNVIYDWKVGTEIKQRYLQEYVDKVVGATTTYIDGR